MAKVRTVFRCTACGADAPRWAGRCSTCGEWNSLVEEIDTPRAATAPPAADRPEPIAEVDPTEGRVRPTGLAELDRVLGGGLVPGSVTLVGGEPGIGKSTLLLQVLGAVARRDTPALLVSAEESKQQVRLRAERLGTLRPNLLLMAETVLPHVIAAVDEVDPSYLVVDSIQTVHDPDLGGAPGSVGQVRECAARLVRLAKERDLTTILVGHVTKEGTLAGPRVLEHVVDTVLAFEGDRHHALRLLRAQKHRFGPTSELGVFEMTGDGLREVPDPSSLFLGDRRPGVAGSAVAATVEGDRPLLVEVQALVARTTAALPRRAVQGLDGSRVAMLLAVLERRCAHTLAGSDVYASAAGGAHLADPGADLAISLALASACSGVPMRADIAACGEVGLGGELRQPAHTTRRLAEAARLGFTRAVVPFSAPDGPAGLELLRATTLREAIEVAAAAVT